ncbi:MAG: efflux transporter outer membrane subunit [Telmatospirillum sp.]|nr:efflux transporter outer membrane subunit [Telmatospirillum sp.]
MTKGPGMVFWARAVVAAVGISSLAACAVGPDYQRPEAAEPAHYKERAADTGIWSPGRPADGIDRGAWWGVFGDPVLDGLMEQVTVSNQNIKAAEAAYRQAMAAADAAFAGLFPTLSGGASGQRSQSLATSRPGGATTSVVGSSFSASLSASWAPDIWGKVRRAVEQGDAAAEASAADLANARLSAQGALAADYFALRYQDALKHLLEATATAYRRSLDITRNQYAAGTAARSDVAQAETQLASTEAQLVATGVQRATLEHAIAVLTGKAPADFSLPDTGVLAAVPDVPAGVPSDLLQRRPDIAAAERRVAAANAAIGIAISAYFPSLTLTGSDGFSSSSLGSLIQTSNNVWSFGPQLAVTLFDAGARSAQVEEARAAYDQSVATYRQTVLAALQAVEDQMAALKTLSAQADVQGRAVASAKEAERLITNQYLAGTVAYTSVVTAQTASLTNQQTALSIAQSRLAATVSLIQALGGGWQVPEASASVAPPQG